MSEKNEIFAVKRVSLDKADTDTIKGYMNEIALLKRLDGNSRIIRLVDSEARMTNTSSKGYLHLVMECGEIGEVKHSTPRMDIDRFFWWNGRFSSIAPGAAEEAHESCMDCLLLGAGQ